MNNNDPELLGSSFETVTIKPSSVDGGPLGSLPRFTLRQARLEARLARINPSNGLAVPLRWLSEALDGDITPGRPEIAWRAAGLRRAGLVAHFTWPRLATQLAIGLETPLAHTIVDRLLGFDRLNAEERLPLSPVEWGIMTFVVAETLRHLTQLEPAPFDAWDLTIERVGPDPFDVGALGRIVTIRWPLKIGAIEGSIRLWLTEGLVARWLLTDPLTPSAPEVRRLVRTNNLASVWRAEAGTIPLPRGLKTLRAGGVLPLHNSTLRGTPQSPTGTVDLTLKITGEGTRYYFATKPVPHSGGGRLTLTSTLQLEISPREGIAMSLISPTPDSHSLPASDVPVTLVVELGRVNLSLSRLADLKIHDIIELGRHSRDPVELTSGGRLVARGELVQIDTELGVRVTQVFL